MQRKRLEQILESISRVQVGVVGDFFLDEYLFIDTELDEKSLETGLTAYQVVERRVFPGAGGTVVNNLCALGVAGVQIISIIGDDGRGLELERGLRQRGKVNTSCLVKSSKRVTPTYTKPMRGTAGEFQEINRIDIKNWRETPEELEAIVIRAIRKTASGVDAIIVSDQVEEANCGVITTRVREALCELGKTLNIPVVVDSRANIGEFRYVSLKPNEREAIRAIGLDGPAKRADEGICRAGRLLQQQAEKPVFLTRGQSGQIVFTAEGEEAIPAIPARGPIDTVGAGDSTIAAITTALCCGASPAEAALFGNLIASVTVEKVGTTGTASPAEVLDKYDWWKKRSIS